MITPGADWDRLGRYLAGELSPAEAVDVQRWLAENAKEDKVLAALAAATTNLPASRPVDIENALRKVKARIAAQHRGGSWGRYVPWAAAAAIIIAIGTWLSWPAPASVGTAAPREFATGVGARDSITLADGSRVILGPASRITVRDRDVDLMGEAFFVVTHNEKRPFTVRAGGSTITDIGTEFSVHSDHDGDVRVVVTEGSVQLARSADSVILAQGDVGVAEQGGRVTAARGAATPDDIAWTTGTLKFRNARMSEVAADLRRWYGVELRVTDSALLKRHFTASFTNASPSQLAQRIGLALGVRAETRGDTVIIRPAAATR